MINVCLAGATGWAGSELARSIAKRADLALVAAVSRKHAGRVLGEVLGEPRLACPVYASAAEALAIPCDVFVEYTKPDSAKANILAALEHGAHVVVGTSGLTDGDFAEIDAARAQAAAWRPRLRQLCLDGRAAAEVRRSRGPAHSAVGDHRLRARRQGRRAERHRSRARDSPVESPPSRSLRFRWSGRSGPEKPAAPRCRARRFTPFACPAM